MATLALGIVALVMGVSQGGPAYFIQLGQKSRALELARDVLGEGVPTPVADGHDGESFWLLARDPTLSGGDDLAQYFDRPLYRAQRIGYPALAAPWRLGGEQALLWGLVLTNLAAVGVGTYLTGANVARQGGARLAGYVFAANPLVWLALLFDFSDAVALAGVMGAVWALRRGRWGPLVACTVVAALAKESSLLGLGAIAVLVPRIPFRQRALLVVPAGLSAALWRLYVMAQPGFTSDPQVEEFVVKPFSGYVEAWRHGWSPMGDWAYAALSIALIPVAVAVVWAWWRHRGSVELCAALPYALFLPFLSGQVLDIPINSVRAVGPAVTLAAAGVLIIRGTAAGTPPPVPILGPDGATSRHRHDP
jgi:hypothetical protein